MKLIAYSHYGDDNDTRYGDCILLYDESTLVVYDCGHQKHAENVIQFLKENPKINSVHIVVSHNDSDHASGVCYLIEKLAENKKYEVIVYTHQLLKYVDDIIDKLKDGRRTRESVKNAILDEFDNINLIIEKAKECGFATIEALENTAVGPCEIVGPTMEQFVTAAAIAIDNRIGDKVGAGHVDETAMNATSIQLKATIGINGKLLLCGDATPDFLSNINIYSLIQLPHHGKLNNAKEIFDELNGDSYKKEYLISDNTGSAESSGGSCELIEYIGKNKFNKKYFYNTKFAPVLLDEIDSTTSTGISDILNNKRRFLGDLDCIKQVDEN